MANNPFLTPFPYVLGFAFATVFLIMFFSSEITQNQLNTIDPSSIAGDITKGLQISCVNDVRCNTRDVPPNLPEAEFRISCISACATLTSEAEDLINQRINQEVNERVGFFPSLFFQPQASKLALTVIILFVVGFGVGAVINVVRK